ncbi:MAG: secondary thiamine-phosphate synthase enzyme [Planctomycetota bacterium]|jgi:secondary thiamine-phosphate synthase enzyme
MGDHQQRIQVSTRGRGLHSIDRLMGDFIRSTGVQVGLCVVFCRHTSASLVIQENADPSATKDLEAWFDKLAPDGDPAYTHTAEGPDDMPSHLRSAVTRSSESIPITDGRLALGRWQGLFLFEHRHAPHTRELVLHVQGS